MPSHPTTSQRSSAAGFSLIELLVVIAIIAVISAVTTIAVLQARIAANEGSALVSLRLIHSAQTAYAASCAPGGYAQSLEDLALPPSGSTQGFLPATLASNGIVKSGYVATVSADSSATEVMPGASTCNAAAAAAVSAFFAEGHPASVGLSGQRSFALQRDGAIYVRHDGLPIAPGMSGASILR